MLDPRMRAMLGPVLDAAGKRLAAAGVPPAALTAAGWAAGAGACAATALRAWPAALGLWLANRLLDGLDGPVAPARTPTDARGGFWPPGRLYGSPRVLPRPPPPPARPRAAAPSSRGDGVQSGSPEVPVPSSRPPAADRARRVEGPPASAGPGRLLRRGSLRFLRTAALPVGIQGPTAGVIIGPAIIAGIVGEPGALAQVLALVAMGFVAYAFVVFTRSFNTAGSVYAFNATALGPGYGFVSAWLLLLVYLSFAAGVYATTADIAQTLLASFGVHVGWVWLAPARAGLAPGLAALSTGFTSPAILAAQGPSGAPGSPVPRPR